MERLIKAKVEPGRVAIHWLGHSGFAFKSHAGEVVVVDPFLSGRSDGNGYTAARQDPPVRPKDVRLDYLFLTHDHGTHMDPHTAPSIAQQNPDAQVICPSSCAHHLTKLGVPGSRIITAMAGQSLEFPSFKVHVVAALHTEDSVGYVFEYSEEDTSSSGPVVYYTGDTEYSETLAASVEDYAPDVVILPIAGERNLDVQLAARLALEIEPREVIPMHFGMFDETDADPDQFVSLVSDTTDNDPSITPVVMKMNSCHIYCPKEAIQGRQQKNAARSQRARLARENHEHHDGLRGPNGGAGITRGGGNAVRQSPH
jgi:L-ascorbate metabolism protein UlaG (beta-lactamase superfamily)